MSESARSASRSRSRRPYGRASEPGLATDGETEEGVELLEAQAVDELAGDRLEGLVGLLYLLGDRDFGRQRLECGPGIVAGISHRGRHASHHRGAVLVLDRDLARDGPLLSDGLENRAAALDHDPLDV